MTPVIFYINIEDVGGTQIAEVYLGQKWDGLFAPVGNHNVINFHCGTKHKEKALAIAQDVLAEALATLIKSSSLSPLGKYHDLRVCTTAEKIRESYLD